MGKAERFDEPREDVLVRGCLERKNIRYNIVNFDFLYLLDRAKRQSEYINNNRPLNLQLKLVDLSETIDLV